MKLMQRAQAEYETLKLMKACPACGQAECQSCETWIVSAIRAVAGEIDGFSAASIEAAERPLTDASLRALCDPKRRNAPFPAVSPMPIWKSAQKTRTLDTSALCFITGQQGTFSEG